ncbi:benomyl/methotrexate resistance protein [Aspergillus crustosus]
MLDIIRDSPAGQVLRLVSKGKIGPYVEETAGFEHPFYPKPATTTATAADDNDSDNDESPGIPDERSVSQDTVTVTGEEEGPKPIEPVLTADNTILVDWYTTDDPENPQNWSETKKLVIGLLICAYSFAVYFGSSIYVGAVPEIIEIFGVSAEVSSLGLALYVIGYGLGPMLFAPLSEIATIGRNPPYIITFGLYMILQIVAAVVNNFAGFMVLRFLTGFFGSPCLATGGATFGDMYPLLRVPYFIIMWGSSTVLGPALAPLIANFSIPVKGWHWMSWEMVWFTAPIFLAFLFFLPETSSSTILHRRAKRLRRILKDDRYRTQSEINNAKKNFTASAILRDAILKPIQLNVYDPAVLFATVYTGLMYGIFYSFFESFAIIFDEVYHFRFEMTGLPFLVVLPCIVISTAILLAFWHYSVVKPFKKIGFEAFGPPERRLIPGLYACWLLPAGLFLCAWTSRPSIHWMPTVIGLGFTIVGSMTIITPIMQFLAATYPAYAASLFAALCFLRSAFAASAIMFSRPMFDSLGIDWGLSLLAFLDLACCFLFFGLWKFGPRLRAMSRFAET